MKRLILNLGCGLKTHPELQNIDWSFYLRLKRSPLLSIVARPFLTKERWRRLQDLPDCIRVHDLRKGIPYPDNSVDAVYHSHMFEHIDRDAAPAFLREVHRVLKPGGIHRICLPDLEAEIVRYVESLQNCKGGRGIPQHDSFVAEIIEQIARKEPASAHEQSRLIRFLERLLIGDARARGETHQWMYDFYNLSHLLREAGFTNVHRMQAAESDIPNWPEYCLEVDDSGRERKPRSLYCESRK